MNNSMWPDVSLQVTEIVFWAWNFRNYLQEFRKIRIDRKADCTCFMFSSLLKYSVLDSTELTGKQCYPACNIPTIPEVTCGGHTCSLPTAQLKSEDLSLNCLGKFGVLNVEPKESWSNGE